VTHREGAHEDVDLPLVLCVVEQHPLRAVQRVEPLVRLVAHRRHRCGGRARGLRGYDDVEVAVPALQCRRYRTVVVESDADSTEQADREIGRLHDAASLREDVGEWVHAGSPIVARWIVS
jgi:hypothetical protein